MPSIDTTWFVKTIANRQLSQRRLAKLLEVNPSSVHRLVTGKRPMRLDEATKLSNLLNVPVSDVLNHAGIRVGPHGRAAPIVGYVDGHGEAHLDWGADAEITPCPEDLPPSSVAVQVRAPTGDKAIMDGWMLFLAPPSGVDPEAMGRMSLIGINGGLTVLRTLRRGYKRGTYNLDAIAATPIQNAVIDWATPVLWIRTG